MISETDPLGNTVQYEYDAVDNLIARTDGNGRRTEFEYDEIDRLIGETWVETEQAIDYSYDKASNLLAAKDRFSALAFTYDNRDRVLTSDNTSTPGAPNVVLSYGYDSVGNVKSVTDTINGVAGGTNAYSFSSLNCLTQLTQMGNNVRDKRVDFGYNAIGQFTAIDRYANLAGTQLVTGTDYVYNEMNRLASLTHNNGTADVAFYNFAYDAGSRITQITDIDGVTDYSYDNRDQLTASDRSDTNNPDESYSYEANGNRVSSSIHGEGYETGDGNRLLSDGTFNYEYDNEGNLIRRTEIATGVVRELEWDYRNRLVAVIDKNAAGNETQRVEYTYDVFDRRIAKVVDNNPQDAVNALVTHFVYDGSDVHLEFVDSDGANEPVLDIRYLQGPEVDQILAQEEVGGDAIWHLTDRLGTIRDLADNSGTVINHITYDSFGNVVSETDADFETCYLFAGREFDEETGLYYYRARYYDGIQGKFLSNDPIGFRGGDPNLYRYVFNSPINASDPRGEATIAAAPIVFIGGGAIIIGGLVILVGIGAGLLLSEILEDGNVESPTDSATDSVTLKPPGDCTQQEWYQLQQAVNDAKANAYGKGCKRVTDKETALMYAILHDIEAATRDAINKKCFRGGDGGHRKRANEARNAAKRCREIATQCC